MTRFEVPRAHRYPVAFGLRYRQSADLPWFDGLTENVSISGVLFVGDQELRKNTTVQVNLMMPPHLVAPAAARVVCVGRVVRVEPPRVPDGRPTLAITIADYRLKRSEHGDEAW